MSAFTGQFRTIPLIRRLVAGGLLALFMMVMSMTVFPQFHRWAHRDADRSDHSCAVTLILSGGTESPPYPAALGFNAVLVFSQPDGHSIRIPSDFLSRRVLEHAPPVRS